MEKPSIKVLKESAAKWGVELAGGSIKAAVDSLHDYFVETYGEDELAQCPVCGNAGPEKDEEDNLVATCPYCGQKFVGAADEKPAPKPDKGAKIAKKRGAEKPPKEEKTEYIATPEQKDELEKHVTRIQTLRQSLAENAWEIGQELITINDNSLWRGLGFESFFAYCGGVLDFSRAMAYKYMLCSRSFKKDEFQLLGVKKGELIAAAPERHKTKLLKAAKTGASFTDLRHSLNKFEGKATGTKGDGKGMTLLGRVKEGDIDVPWLSTKSHKPITKADVKGKYARVQITEEIELVLVPTENELGMVVNFRKVGETAPTKEAPKDATKPAPATA